MRFIVFIITVLSALPVQAQEIAASNDPLEITADNSLEWNRSAKTYTATENARAVQGLFSIAADRLQARYEDANDTSNITELTAQKSVVLTNAPYSAYGDTGVYDLKTGVATLTGTGLKIITPTETITARDKLEYRQKEQRFFAVGNAVAVRGTDTIQSDILSAAFEKDAKGEMFMRQMQADGNVTINTKTETITGEKGVYDTVKQLAIITGNVRLKQGENWVEGARAEVDLKTGLSRLFAGKTDTGETRVKGMFYPKKEGAK